MAPVHFRIVVDRHAAMVQHLAGGFVTFVNRQPVGTQVLSHGDVLCAGNSEFEIGIESLSACESNRGPERSAAAMAKLAYERQFLAHGTDYLRGTESQAGAPVALLQRLMRSTTVYLLANFSRAAMACPDDFSSATDLLAGLPAAMRTSDSLHCACATDLSLPRFRQLWGKDALITIAGRVDPASHLRAHLGVFTRPGLLRRQLDNRSRYSQLLPPDTVWLLETTDGKWQLFRSARGTLSWGDLQLAG